MKISTFKKGGLRKKAIAVSAALAVASLSLVSASASADTNPGFVLYSSQGYAQAVIDAYNATNPGFTVTLKAGSTGPLLQQIQAEGTNPSWGALWIDGAIPFEYLDSIGMLVKNSVPKVPNYTTLGTSNVPKDASYVPTGVTETGVLCYDTAQVSAANLPNNWNDLSTTSYALGMNDPSISGPTFPLIAGVFSKLSKLPFNATAAQIKAAITKGEAFYKAIAAKRGGLVVNATNGSTINAMKNHAIGMATVQGSACYSRTLSSFTTLAEKYLDASIVLPSAIGVDSKMPATVRSDALKFAAWVLTPAGQTAMKNGDPTGDSLFWPVVKNITPANAIIPALSSTNPYVINPKLWAPYQTEISTWFDQNFVN
jgi:iron(III) transport system substrate-binding protein